MIKNYIKVALRTLLRNKGYALINILGLAIGITGATLLLTYVQDEVSFESTHVNSEHIVRPILKQVNVEPHRYFAGNPLVFANILADELPEVKAQAYMIQYFGGQFNLRMNDERLTERSYAVANNDQFKVFTYDFLHGNPETALSNPMEIVLSESKAIAFFGKTDVLDELVEAPGIGQFKVVGVFKDQPKNTFLQIDVLISQPATGERWENVMNSWTSFGGSSFLLLNEGTDFEAFSAKAAALAEERMPEFVAGLVDYEFQKLEDVHFNSAHLERDIAENKGDSSYIVIFIILSVFLVAIASINYMNLATSKAVFRAKEIGVRKVVGAAKNHLIAQFLTESLMITTLATLISIGLLDLTTPAFNSITDKAFDFSWTTLSQYLPLMIGLTVVVAFLSGLYPAFFMTRMRAVIVLKGENKVGGSFKIRQALVVFQFVLSIFMIIATLVVSQQMSFIKEKNLGFDQSNLIVLDINNGAVRPVFKTMRNQLATIPGVENVSVTSRVPGEWKNINETEIQWLRNDEPDSTTMFYMSFDENALDVFDFKLKDGNYFIGNDASDSTKILINEAAAKLLGFDQPIGESIELQRGVGTAPHQIIGVIEDFHFQSLHSEISPIIIGAWNNRSAIIDYFTIKYNGEPEAIISRMEEIHETFDNRTVMEYHFLDQQLELFYQTEEQASTIFQIGAGLSIFIACLGLFGLASFTIQKRMKELGVRKVLGASELQLFGLLSSSFSKQILLAFILASPLAYFLMTNWLQNFEYRTSLGFGVFILAGASTLLIALITISYRSLKAANSNPVKSLRSE